MTIAPPPAVFESSLPPAAAVSDVDALEFRDGRFSPPPFATPLPCGSARLLVVAIEGNITTQNRERLKHFVVDELHAGRKRVVLDLTACGYLDASAIGALVSMTNTAKRMAGGRLVLCGLNEDLATLFELTRMAEVFEVLPTLLDALAAFEARAET